MNNPTGSQANRRVFLSKPLTKDVRLSGTPTADLLAQFGQVRVSRRDGLLDDQRRRLGRLPGAVVPQLPGPQRRDRGVLRDA